jgi:hypothetical protein
MFHYKVWFAGSAQPVEFDLDTDELLTKFIEWTQGNNAVSRGYVCKKDALTRVINFGNVANMESLPAPARRGRSMVDDDPNRV